MFAECFTDPLHVDYSESGMPVADYYFLLRGSYTNHMVRTSDGWRIERIIQHVSWADGNQDAVAEAIARSEARHGWS